MGLRITGTDAFRDRVLRAVPHEPSVALHCIELDDASLSDVRGIVADRVEGEAVMVSVGGARTPHIVRSLAVAAEIVIAAADLDHGVGPAVAALQAGLRTVSSALFAELRAPDLSSREKQVLAMLVLDMSNGEIARKLHVSESNVKFHLSAAFRKLGVSSRAAAAALILDPDAGLGPGILRITVDGAEAN